MVFLFQNRVEQWIWIRLYLSSWTMNMDSFIFENKFLWQHAYGTIILHTQKKMYRSRPCHLTNLFCHLWSIAYTRGITLSVLSVTVLLIYMYILYYEISHDDRKDIIKTHNYSNFAFWVQKCGFWTKIIASLKTTGLLQNQQWWVQETFSENVSLIRSFV